MIASKTKVIEILNSFDIKPKKHFGQNFLIDGNIARKIVNLLNLDSETGVIEIGPGMGAITELVVKEAKKVVCFEIDPTMCEILNKEIKVANFELHNEDFLNVDLQKQIALFDECERLVVVSNLPYYVTTPIIMKLLSCKDKFKKMVFMVQTELAEKMMAKPCTKLYGSLSVIVRLLTNPKMEFPVNHTCFYPQPNVESYIISMEHKDDADVIVNEELMDFVFTIFKQKRKTLNNNLKGMEETKKSKIMEMLNTLGYKNNVRAEEIAIEDIVKIYKSIY